MGRQGLVRWNGPLATAALIRFRVTTSRPVDGMNEAGLVTNLLWQCGC